MRADARRSLLSPDTPRLKGGGIALCPEHQYDVKQRGLEYVLMKHLTALARSARSPWCPSCGSKKQPYRINHDYCAFKCRDCKRRWGLKADRERKPRLSDDMVRRLYEEIERTEDKRWGSDNKIARRLGIHIRTVKRYRLKLLSARSAGDLSRGQSPSTPTTPVKIDP